MGDGDLLGRTLGASYEMNQKQINKILKENKEVFEILENYDKTRELPFQRKKIYLTLAIATINKLKKLRE